MIEVKVLREKGKLRGYEVSGHAKFNAPGEDIVCAAVSALAQTGIFSLNRLVSIEPCIEVEDGFLSCYVTEDLGSKEGAKEKEVELVISTVLIGIYETARVYPERIKIIDERGAYQC